MQLTPQEYMQERIAKQISDLCVSEIEEVYQGMPQEQVVTESWETCWIPLCLRSRKRSRKLCNKCLNDVPTCHGFKVTYPSNQLLAS